MIPDISSGGYSGIVKLTTKRGSTFSVSDDKLKNLAPMSPFLSTNHISAQINNKCGNINDVKK